MDYLPNQVRNISPFTINMYPPSHIRGTAHVKKISVYTVTMKDAQGANSYFAHTHRQHSSL